MCRLGIKRGNDFRLLARSANDRIQLVRYLSQCDPTIENLKEQTHSCINCLEFDNRILQHGCRRYRDRACAQAGTRNFQSDPRTSVKAPRPRLQQSYRLYSFSRIPVADIKRAEATYNTSCAATRFAPRCTCGRARNKGRDS